MSPAPTTALNLNNDVTIPAIGLGVFQSPPEETISAVEAAEGRGEDRERRRLPDTRLYR